MAKKSVSIRQQWEQAAVNAAASQTVKITLSLSDFVRESWEVLEPSTDLLWNWHIDAMCWHIQETLLDWFKHKQNPHYSQRIQNLLINVPPGSLKSRVVSVCTPAWFWTICPSWRAIFLSANPRVALRDSVYCRDVVESDWYQKRFSPDWKLRDDNNSKTSFWNTKGGVRSAFGFNSRITGDRGDCLLWDDPHDAQEVNSELIRQGVIDRWDSAIRNRVNDLKSSVRIGIMQRLHEQDLSGHVLKQGRWQHLCIPQEFETQLSPTALGWVDPRTESGELMFPERFSKEVLQEEKTALGSYGYAGQHQQRPAPADGGHFKRSWWKYYLVAPDDFELIIQSWDCTFKETKKSDFVVGQVWGKRGGQFYLLDQVRDRMDFPTTLAAIRALSAKYPNSTAKLVEDKANGPAVISSLEREIPGIIAIEPEGGKLVRAVAIAPFVEAGNVFLPDPSIASWVGDFVQEFSTFPNGSNDDQCLVAGTMIATLYGDKPIEDIISGDLVITHLGIRRVLWAGKTGVKPVIERAGMIGTSNHPVFSWGDNFVKMDSITQASKLSKINICDLTRHHLLSLLSSMVSLTDSWEQSADTISLSQNLIKEGRALKACTLLFGSFVAGKQFQKAGLFTIRMVTHLTMTFLILSVYQGSNIINSILSRTQKNKVNICKKSEDLLQSGINHQKAENGIDNIQKRSPKHRNPRKLLAYFAARFLCRRKPMLNTAALSVDTSTERLKGFTGSSESASNAENYLLQTFLLTQQELPKLAANLVLCQENENQEVYNLEVEEAHTYYANGILVHNCDSTSQAINWLASKVTYWAVSHDNTWGS